MENKHFLLISCAAQGHINPMLQLGKQLTHAGAARVTFVTTVHGLTQIKSFPALDKLQFASFSDGFDDGIKPTNDLHHIMSELERVGSKTLTELILALSKEGNPVSFLIYSILLPWAADVARYMAIPSAFLCIQSTTTFALCYCSFNTHDGVYDSVNDSNPPPISMELHGLPPFASQDLPSFLLPNDPYASTLIPMFQRHIQILEKDSNPCVLLNTFDCLEKEAIRTIGKLNPIPIGPLTPFGNLLDKNDPSGISVDCDLFEKSTECIPWLNSKPKGSVVYVSFGSFAVLQRKQMEEMLLGLMSACKPFLWVIRRSGDKDREIEEMIKNKVSEEQGLIVPWCSQMEVLTHKSLGCFVTHCGWNSTMESLVAGIPVVGFPQFGDQTTNAKMVEEVWRTGVRARVNEDGILEAEEIRKCLEMVMERGEEIRRNANKWRGLALEAVKEGGPSYNNLKAFQGIVK